MKKERLCELLHRAILWIDNKNSDLLAATVVDEYEWYEEAIGIAKAELLELGIDWLNDGSTSDDEIYDE